MVIFDNVNLERINIKINVEQIPNINPNAKNLFTSGDAFGNKVLMNVKYCSCLLIICNACFDLFSF